MSSEVPENTQSAALRRSEAYLAETQRLTRTGSFAIEVTRQAVTYSSAEHSRLYGFDPAHGLPSIEDFFERIHPDDRAMCMEAMSKGIRELTDVEVEYRVLIPGSPPRIIHAFGHPVPGASGEPVEIVGTIVDVTERREAEALTARVAEEQAALRRVATLVATEAPPAEVFGKVAEEAARVIGDVDISLWRDERDGTATMVAACGNLMAPGTRLATDGNGVIATVLREGRPHWTADNRDAGGAIVKAAQQLGITAGIGSPILVGGRVWGALGAARTGREPLAPGAEAQLGQFAALVATAIANAQARTEVERLADEQAALRGVATLVAQGVEAAELFAAVSREVGRMFGSDMAAVGRFDPDGPAHVVVGLARTFAGVTVGSRWPLHERMTVTAVYRTGRSARADVTDWSGVDEPIAVVSRELRTVSSVSSPVMIEGRVWGAITVAASEPLPRDAEQRLEKFTELIATAVANAESRDALSRLVEEQAALRRVATLVAQGASPAAVFDAVAAEMEALLQADGGLTMCRYEPDGELTIVAHRGAQAPQLPPGRRIRHDDPHSVTATVRRTGQPARQDTYTDTHGSIGHVIERLRFRSGVGVPILVDGGVWGVTVANWMGGQPPPPETERRMAQFGELLDTAIANADGRDQLNASRARLLTTADDVRRGVVRDLHDGAQQRLVHGIVSLKLARRALQDDDRELRSLVDEALEHVERGNAELRELAHGILPAILTYSGLRAAIGTVVSRLDLPVRVDVSDQRFPAEVEASAYFTVAEALTNVLKHAEATSAEVTASATDVALRIEVRDDGIGGADPDGAGLLGLQDRAAALGGWLTIQSPAGGGTVLAATLPLTRV
jgi:signal transduction histidine kinase